jgi:medium-chain acyl-[acyl-carrier-protein] hydrolase
MIALSEVVKEVALAIRPYLDRPFALFGHSLGALLAFELARRLRQEESIGPVHLFASGCPAPQLTSREPPTHLLPEPEFLERLKTLNGTPQEILAHPELMQLMVPLLRADFELAETYNYVEAPPLTCSISVYGGLQDAEVDRVKLEAWQQQTSARFTLRLLPGGHFFLHDVEPVFLNTLTRDLLEIDRGLV